jgi:peptidoglycan/LPS O-acetylase OafA/YrhL
MLSFIIPNSGNNPNQEIVQKSNYSVRIFMKKSLSHSNNNFDFLRLLGAFLVIVSHSFVLTLNGVDPLYILSGSTDLGVLGVAMFFVISGFLIAQSWHFDQSLHFIWKRFLRLIPGLIAVTIFTVFILGPVVTTVSLKEYFTNPMTWSYFKSIALYLNVGGLPGVFTNNPYPNTVNGSLWTLPIEVTMYVLLMISGFLGLLGKKKLMTSFGIILVVIYFLNDITHFALYTSFTSQIFTSQLNVTLLFSLFFIMGSIYFVNKDSIKWDNNILLTFIILWVFSFRTMFFNVASLVFLPYIILCIAQMPLPFINKASKYGDFSYGLYIYAFPIQQTIILYLGRIPIVQMILLSILCTLPLSMISWNLIESKALKLKKIHISKLLKSKISEIYYKL